MSRFRKGTNDADGDGRKGGSLPNDDRADYERVGSGYDPGAVGYELQGRASKPRKGDGDMVKVKGAGPKTKTVKKVAPKAKAVQPEAEAAKPEPKPAKLSPEQLAAQVEQADLEESIGRHPGGMEPPLSEDAKKAALDAQFAEADAVGDPRRDEQAAILQVRGF